MKQPDFDRAFGETPACVRAAIEMGFRKGAHASARRRRLTGAVGIAAAVTLLLTVALFTASRMGAPRPDVFSPGRPRVTPSPTPAPTEASENGEGAINADVTVYATQAGRYYHSIEDCSGMQGALPMTAAEAAELGKSPCPVCAAEGEWLEAVEISAQELVEPAEVHAQENPEPAEIPAQEAPGTAAPAETPAPEVVYVTATEAPAPEVVYADAPAQGVVYADAPGAVQVVDASGVWLLFSDASVYATPGGAYFHRFDNCSGMQGALRMSVAEATKLGKNPCPICAAQTAWLESAEVTVSPKADAAALFESVTAASTKSIAVSIAEATVAPGAQMGAEEHAAVHYWNVPAFYYTPNGTWFHLAPDCSGMRNAEAHSLEALLHQTKKPCPVCFPDEASRELYRLSAPEGPEDSVLMSTIAGVSGCFHRDPCCFGMPMSTILKLRDAEEMLNLTPCPACLPELAGGDSSPACFVDTLGALYHAERACPKLEGAPEETTQARAQAAGRMRCPRCAAAAPEGERWFELLFGKKLSEVAPEYGYIYERTDPQADGSALWYLSNGTEVVRFASFAPDGAGGGALAVSDGMGRSVLPDGLLEDAPEPLRTLVRKYASAALEEFLIDKDELAQTLAWPTAVTLRFDADGRVTACELRFDSLGGSCALGWEADEDGAFALRSHQCLGDGWTEAAMDGDFDFF